jgi:hypothetical protein
LSFCKKNNIINKGEFMDVTSIKNKLITFKTYGGLKKDLVDEIQTALLTKNKESDFAALLKKVETEVDQSIKK